MSAQHVAGRPPRQSTNRNREPHVSDLGPVSLPPGTPLGVGGHVVVWLARWPGAR